MKIKKVFLTIIVMTLIFSFSAGIVTFADTLKYSDVKETDWYASDVTSLSKLSIINGKPQKDGTVIFDPKGLVTKSELTKMLVEAMNYVSVDGNSFSDVGYNRHWAKKHIETAVKEGIINPADEGDKFWPDIPIKRQDMALMMFKALRLEPSNNKSPFPDIDIPFATKLHEEYLIAGVLHNGNIYFKADGLTTRAEAATVIARMIEYKSDPEGFKKKQAIRNEINTIPVTKALKITDGKNYKNEKEFWDYQSKNWKYYMGMSFERSDLTVFKGDDSFKDIALVYYYSFDADSNRAFEFIIMNNKALEGYKIKYLCVNRPNINYGVGSNKENRGQIISRSDWKIISTGEIVEGLVFPLVYSDRTGNRLWKIEKGELLDFRIFIDSGKEVRSYEFTVKVGDNKLYKK